MSPPPIPLPPNEAGRLAALRDYGILDSPPEQAFDDLARLAAETCGVPIALISFVDADRVWMKARLGVTTSELPRHDSLCAHAILSPHRFLVSDLRADPRYAKHPAVTGPEALRLYAGVPLTAPGGFAVGVLCVLDRQPRVLDATQLEALEIIARQVITHLELRRNLRRLEHTLADHERTATALRLAETRYRSIFENVAEGIFQTTQDGRYVSANPMLARIYGHDSPEALQAAVQNIKGQLYVDPARRDEFIRQMREKGEVRHFESLVRRKDGSHVWVSENARSVHDARGRFLYYEGTVEDITDRKQAEEALRNNELLYHSLVDALPQNIFRKDRSGRFTFANQLFCQTLKRPAAEILGRTDYDFFPADLAANYQADDRKVMDQLIVLEKTEEHIKPEGSKLYVHVIKTPLRDSSGEVIGVQGIFWDETERHRMEADLAYERDLLRSLLDNVPDAIYFKSRRSKFIRASRALARKFGLDDPEKLVGKSDFDFFTAEHAKPAYDDEQRIMRTGEPILDVTEKETWPDGHVTWVRSSKLPLRDRRGRIIGTFGISKDVTDLIRVEQELEKARDAALGVARLKAEILANMSHEIRTPMNAIIGTADLLRRSPLTPEQREFADQIHHGAETLLSIINGILDLSRLESGRLELEQIEFDLRDTVESAVELLAETAHTKGLDLVCWIEPDVPSTLRGDPVRLRQIMTNLVGNAIKFTKRGEVAVRVTIAGADEAAVTLRFEVQDTGVGVPVEMRQEIFEPFRQADGSTTRRYGGTGLGLAISSQLVRSMGGEISLASEVNVGSTFAFTLPFGRPALLPSAPQEPAHPLRGLRILVVDDHAGSRRVLLQTLRRWGVVAEESDDAATALHQLRAAAAQGRPFACVLTDFSLSEVTGVELAVAIKGMPDLPQPRIVLLTSLSNWLDAELMRTHGIAACLLKPPRHSRLYAVLVGLRDPAAVLLAPAAPETPSRLPGRALRVLVAEDNEFNRRLVVRQLASLGHQALTAANGNEVLDLLTRETADVLLLDCQMPELDGYQTARALRQREAAPTAAGTGQRPLHIVALTAHALPGDREKCLAAGMNDFLTKPVRIEDIEAALRRAQENPGSPATTAVAAAAESAPALDPSALNALGGDAAGLAELGELFFSSAASQLERMAQAVAEGNAATLQAAAHSLKGSAVNFGARELGLLAARMEGNAKLRHLDGAIQALEELRAELDRVRSAWQEFIARPR